MNKQMRQQMSKEEYQRVMFGEIDGVYPQDCGPSKSKTVPRYMPAPDKWDDIVWLYQFKETNSVN